MTTEDEADMLAERIAIRVVDGKQAPDVAEKGAREDVEREKQRETNKTQGDSNASKNR